MKTSLIGMVVVTVILMVLGVIFQGPAILIKGFLVAGKMLINVIPLLIAAFLLMGLIQVLISKEFVEKWFGHESGIKGIILGSVAGGLVPGGPYVFYPLAATFLLSGADIGTIIAFIVAKNLWSVSRIPMEVALIGPKITAIRYAITFVFPIVLGIIVNTFFKSWGEKVRAGVRRLQKKEGDEQ